MANQTEMQKERVLSSWEAKIEPFTVNGILYRNIEGMDPQMRKEIRDLSDEGYMRLIKLKGSAIGLDHGEKRLFSDGFRGGIYYFFLHRRDDVIDLISDRIKPGAMNESRNRSAMTHCLKVSGFTDNEATLIIGKRVEKDMGAGMRLGADIRRNTH